MQVGFNEDKLPAFWIVGDFMDGMDKIPQADRASIKLQAYWGPQFQSAVGGQATVSFFCYDPPFGFGCDDEWLYLFQQDVRQLVSPFRGLPNRVPLHEMGHPVMYWMYGGDHMPAPSTDYWLFGFCNSWQPQNPISGQRDCAWMEGWADYWRILAQGSFVVTYLNGDSDNYEEGKSDPAGAPPPYSWSTGDEVPGRIAGALWDIYDSVVDTDGKYDAFTTTSDVIWDVFNDGAMDETFEHYWIAWRSHFPLSLNNNQCAATSIYQSTISYNADGWVKCADGTPSVKLGETVDPDERTSSIRVPVEVTRFELPGSTVQVGVPGGLGKFLHKITYSPDDNNTVRGIRVLEVDLESWFPNNPIEIIDNPAGVTTFGGQNVAEGSKPPTTLPTCFSA